MSFADLYIIIISVKIIFCRCPLDDCGSVYLYPSALKKHLKAHIKKEKSSKILHYLETRLNELETFVRPCRSKVKEEIPALMWKKSKVKEEIPQMKSRQQRPMKIPRTKDSPKGQKKLIAWYVRRKKRLLKDFGMTNSGRNSRRARIRDARIFRKYRCQEGFKCKRCNKILKTTDGFKYHLKCHNINKRGRSLKRRDVEIAKRQNTCNNGGVEDRRKSIEIEEKETIQKFLQIYKKGERYHCDKCFHITSVPKQGDFREHLYKKHNVFEPSLRHYECNDCTPVFRTIKQNKMEAHLHSASHIKMEKAKMAFTSRVSADQEELDGTSLTANGTKRTELLRVVKQYQHGSAYGCPQCGKNMEKIDVFVEHMYVEHDVKLSSKDCNYYQCEDCFPEFRTCSKAKLRKHELGVRHKKTVELKLSKKRGNDDEIGIEPARKKSKVSPTEQKKSNKSYTVTFTDTEIFRCDPCGLTFSAINDLGNHLDTNHREKIRMFFYKCKICTITENSLTNFREHMKTDDHELEVALARSKAEYEASKQTASNIPRNVILLDQGASSESEESGDEGVQIVISVTDKGLKCVTCKFVTKSFSEIKSHSTDRHHGKKETIVYDCEFCKFKCSRAKDAQIHIISDGHEANMNDTFWEYAKITTDIAFKITRKDQIVCSICRLKIFSIERLLIHAKEKHELPPLNIRIVCIVCCKILIPAEIENHQKTDNHLRLVEKEFESSDTDSCPPTKKSRLEEVDDGASFEQQIAEERSEPQPQQLEALIEEVSEASSLEIEVPEQHDEPPAAEVAAPEPQAPARAPQAIAPVRQARAPIRQAPAPAPQAIAPVRQAPAPVRQAPAPAPQAIAPVRQAPAPVRQAPAPAPQAIAPVRQAPAPVRQAPAPAPQAIAQVRQAPAPVRQAPAPVRQAPAPARQAPAPVRQAPAPVRQAPAPVRQAPAPAPPPFRQPYRQVTLADYTTTELFEELISRDDYYPCQCGFAFYKDKVASYLHKSCHAVNDWHKCSNCYRTFPDPYSFITHLFCKEDESSISRDKSSS